LFFVIVLRRNVQKFLLNFGIDGELQNEILSETEKKEATKKLIWLRIYLQYRSQKLDVWGWYEICSTSYNSSNIINVVMGYY